MKDSEYVSNVKYLVKTAKQTGVAEFEFFAVRKLVKCKDKNLGLKVCRILRELIDAWKEENQ